MAGHCLIRVYRAGLWCLACTRCPYFIEDHPRALKGDIECPSTPNSSGRSTTSSE